MKREELLREIVTVDELHDALTQSLNGDSLWLAEFVRSFVREREHIASRLQRILSKLEIRVHVRCYWCHDEWHCYPVHQIYLGEHKHPYEHQACYASRQTPQLFDGQ